jgi:hypothetical protein
VIVEEAARSHDGHEAAAVHRTFWRTHAEVVAEDEHGEEVVGVDAGQLALLPPLPPYLDSYVLAKGVYVDAMRALNERHPSMHRDCITLNYMLAAVHIKVSRNSALDDEGTGGVTIPRNGHLHVGGRTYAVQPAEATYLTNAHLRANELNTLTPELVNRVVDAIVLLRFATRQRFPDLYQVPQPAGVAAAAAGGGIGPPALPPGTLVGELEFEQAGAMAVYDNAREAHMFVTHRATHNVALPDLSIYQNHQFPGVQRLPYLTPQTAYDALAFVLLLPGGIGGSRARSNFYDDILSIGGRYRFSTILRVVKAIIYQRLDDLALAPRVAELFLLDALSRANQVRDMQMSAMRNVVTGYTGRVARARELLREMRLNPGATTAEAMRRIGVQWNLPPSVPYSPAYQSKKISEGMAVVARRGDPTFFITMTTNAKKASPWPEIAAMLRAMGLGPNDDPMAHPIVCARAFKGRLAVLEQLLRNGTLFGVTMDYLQRTVENQTRGGVHSHTMGRVKGPQPHSAQDVDRLVSARLFHAELCPARLPRDVPEADPNQTDEQNHAEGRCSCFAHTLTRLVSKHMMHTCGDHCKSDPSHKYHVPGKCKKKFPYDAEAHTRISESDGRWLYARAPEDAYVVSYNPILLMLFQCHINVDICTGPGAARYIRKYTTKQMDTTKMRVKPLTANDDPRMEPNEASRRLHAELTEWREVRVVSSSAAVWELTETTVQLMQPAVDTYRIHLPDEHMVREDDETQEIVASSHFGSAMLRYFARPDGERFDDKLFLTYFEENNVCALRGASPRAVLDHGIPITGTFPMWVTPRSISRTPGGVGFVACIQRVPYQKTELFALKQLLLHYSARSFEDLYDGHPTFAARATALGLISNADEAYQALQYVINPHLTHAQWREAHRWPDEDDDDDNAGLPPGKPVQTILAYPAQIRQLFVTLLLENDRASNQPFFDDFWPYLLPHPPVLFPSLRFPGADAARGAAEQVVRQMLSDMNVTLQDVGITPVAIPERWGDDDASAAARMRAKYTVVDLEQDANLPLTNEQRGFCDRVIDTARLHIERMRRQPEAPTAAPAQAPIFLLNGHAGVGKSRTLKVLIAKMRQCGWIVQSVALMGIAASILRGGETAHRMFKLPLDDPDRDRTQPLRSGIREGTMQAATLRVLHALIIDEISMLSNPLLDAIDRILREIRQCDLPFGGLVVIFAGDCKQLMQITKSDDMQRIMADSPVSNPHFIGAMKTNLRRQHRVNDQAWGRFALEVGYGVLDATRCEHCDEAPADAPTCEACRGLSFIANEVKNGIMSKPLPNIPGLRTTTSVAEARGFIRPNTADTILAVHNATVMEHLSGFVPYGDPRVVVTRLSAVNQAPSMEAAGVVNNAILTDEMMTVNLPTLPPSELMLWPGARIMLLRNLFVPLGLFNGQILKVVSVHRHIISATIEKSEVHSTTRIHHIPRCKLDGTVASSKFTRLQFPVRLAYAMTANKSQGQTLTDRVVIDLRHESFSHGQLYVALTRVISRDQIMLLLPANVNGPQKLVSHTNQRVLAAANDIAPVRG